jgi:hypothetical protein
VARNPVLAALGHQSALRFLRARGHSEPIESAMKALGPAAVGVNFLVKVVVARERPLIEEHPPLARAPTKLS